MGEVRTLIEIDEALCDGCGRCIPSCHEGALRIIDGKARLVSDALCDGLGACLGECPRGALRVVARRADLFVQAPVPSAQPPQALPVFAADPAPAGAEEELRLAHWPVQIRLVPPHAPFLRDASLVVAADCVPVAMPGFRREFVDGRAVMIGCPKFDDLEEYAARFAQLFSAASVRSVSVVVMEVPCCRSLPTAVLRGMSAVGRSIPVECVIVGIDGEVRERVPLNAGR